MYVPITKEAQKVLEVMVEAGWLRKTEGIERVSVLTEYKPFEPMKTAVLGNGLYSINSLDNFLDNGKTIETNFEDISKLHIGYCEDRKEWAKTLKEAVKQRGHDALISSFYEWSLAQSGATLRKPITYFLKDLERNVTIISGERVSNPALDKVTKTIAIITNNKVFFDGGNRTGLAVLLREYGQETVVQAFREFWPTVTDKELTWAARNFVGRAAIIINTFQTQKNQQDRQTEAVSLAESLAKAQAEKDIEEDEI